MGNEMKKTDKNFTFLKGRAYDLNHLLDVPDYEIFLLEEGGHSFDWGKCVRINLGRRRIQAFQTPLFLIVIDKIQNIRIEKMELPPSDLSEEELRHDADGHLHPMIHLPDYLRKQGISCKSVTGLQGRSYTGHRAWEDYLEHSEAVFTEHGSYFQESGWCDGSWYRGSLCLSKKGWLTIDGHDIKEIFSNRIYGDIGNKVKTLIEEILCKSHAITEGKMKKIIEENKLQTILPYLYFEER